MFSFRQSLVSAQDRVTDFAIGADKIDLFSATGLALLAPISYSRGA